MILRNEIFCWKNIRNELIEAQTNFYSEIVFGTLILEHA